MQRQPVGHQHPVTRADDERKKVVIREVGIAGAGRDIQRSRECPVAADEYLSRQKVPSHRKVVIRQFPSIVRQNRCATAQFLETCFPDARLTVCALDEQAFADVIRQPCAIHGVRLEILDAHQAEERTDLEVVVVDFRRLDFAAVDLGLDHRLRLVADHLDGLAATTAGHEREYQRDAQPPQKKNENPTVHASGSSLLSLSVKTT